MKLAGAVGRNGRHGAVRRDLRCVKQLKDALRRGQAGLHEGQHSADLAHGLAEEPGELDESLEAADGHGSRGDLERTHNGHCNVVEVGDKHHQRLHDAGQELGSGTRPRELAVVLPETHRRLLLPAESLDHLVPGEELFELGVQCPRAAPLLLEMRLGMPGHEHRDGRGHRHRQDSDQCQQRREPQHHGECGGEHEEGHDQLVQELVQGLGDIVDVVRGPAEHVAAALLLEMAGRQHVEFLLHRAAEPVAEALHSCGRQAALDPAEQRRPNVHGGDRQQPLGQLLLVEGAAQEASDDDVGGVAQDLGGRHVECHERTGGSDDTGHPPFQRQKQAQQPGGGLPLDAFRDAGPPGGSGAVCPPAAHGVSSNTIWDSAISW